MGGAKESFQFGEGTRRLFCKCFAEMDTLGIVMLKKIQNQSNRVPKTTEKEPEGNQKGANVSQETFKKML